MCCKSTTDEGLVYKDEDFKNFYMMEPPAVKNGRNEPPREESIMIKSEAFTASNTINDSVITSGENLDRSKNLLKSLNTMNTASTKVNYAGVDQNLSSSLKIATLSKQANDTMDALKGTTLIPKMLKIIIKESKYNNVGDELNINSKGLVGSLRQTQGQDGHVYFGHKSDDIDYYLNPEEGIQSKHFVVKYDQKINEYLVSNIKGSGVFIKICKPFELKDGLIISFGTNHIVVSITLRSEEQKYCTSIIKFKAIYGPNKGKD